MEEGVEQLRYYRIKEQEGGEILKDALTETKPITEIELMDNLCKDRDLLYDYCKRVQVLEEAFHLLSDKFLEVISEYKGLVKYVNSDEYKQQILTSRSKDFRDISI
jgi:hypothetical protein